MSKKSKAEAAAALAAAAPATAAPVEPEVRGIPLDLLDDWPLNPRKRATPEEDKRDTLSIAHHGILMALLVRPKADGRFEVIAGNRRRRNAVAARDVGADDEAGMHWQLPPDYQAPCQVRALTDQEALRLAYKENKERVDMHALDEMSFLDALLPTVQPREKETRAAALAREFPTQISERGVYRRLSLKKLCDELLAALDKDKITLAQAEAFAVGGHDDQRAHWQSMQQHSMFASTPADIKRTMLRQRVPFSRAIFDLALYTGEVVSDPDTDNLFFADTAEFAALQATAVEQKKAELAADWLWVEIMHSPAWDAYQTNGIKKNDQDAGAVIVVRRDNSVEIIAPAILKATFDARRDARGAAGSNSTTPGAGGKGKAAAEAARLQPIELTKAIHHDKTRALRAGIADTPRVALALDVLALLGCTDEVMIDGDTYCRYEHKTGPIAMPMVTGMHIEDLLKKAAAAIPAAQRPNDKAIRAMLAGDHGTSSTDETEHDYPARWFRALLSLEDGDLHELHALLVAACCASWLGDDGEFHYGDSPLAVAIAEAVDGSRRLAEAWSPGREWFAGYSHKRLIEIGRVHLRIRNPERLKKDALIDACLEQPRGFWTPALLPEAAFQVEADAVKALTAPLAAAEPDDGLADELGNGNIVIDLQGPDADALRAHGLRPLRALVSLSASGFEARALDPDHPFLTATGFVAITEPRPRRAGINHARWAVEEIEHWRLTDIKGKPAKKRRALVPIGEAYRDEVRRTAALLAEGAFGVELAPKPPRNEERPSADPRAGDPADIEAHVLGVLRQRTAPIDDLAIDSGFTRNEINDAVMRLLARGAVRPSDDGYRLPADPRPAPARSDDETAAAHKITAA